MKVLIITTLYPPHIQGGAEITINTIAEALVKDGVEVSVLVTKRDGDLTLETINGVRVWRAGLKNVYWHNDPKGHPAYKKALWHSFDIFNPLMPPFAEKVFNTEKPDIIQIHVTTGWTASMLRWATGKGVPTIQVLHGYYTICINGNVFGGGVNCTVQCTKCKIARTPHRIYTNRMSAVVGCSAAVLDKHVKFGYFGGIPSHNVIHNARDPIMLGDRAAAVFGDPADPVPASAPDSETGDKIVKFGFMGSLAGTKGLELLMQTFIEVSPQNTQLLIAGTGEAEYVRNLQETFRHDRVIFIGKSDPASFFGSLDVAVVPSLWNDPLPGVTFEALAFGCPVIGSTRGGIQEMVQVGVNGLIFDPDKPAELADAIVTLATDTELRERFSRNASPSVREYFSIPRICSDYQALYRKLLKLEAAQPSTVTVE